MEDSQNANTGPELEAADLRGIIRQAVSEFISLEQTKAEPAYKAELLEERRRREQLESRVNELMQENLRTRSQAEEAERSAAVRAELQRLGVTKVDLAYRAIKEDILRRPEGRLTGRTASGEVPLREYLEQFVSDNPELLPARMVGASGAAAPQRAPEVSPIDIDRIKPGMAAEELEKIRREIARIASQSGLTA